MAVTGGPIARRVIRGSQSRKNRKNTGTLATCCDVWIMVVRTRSSRALERTVGDRSCEEQDGGLPEEDLDAIEEFAPVVGDAEARILRRLLEEGTKVELEDVSDVMIRDQRLVSVVMGLNGKSWHKITSSASIVIWLLESGDIDGVVDEEFAKITCLEQLGAAFTSWKNQSRSKWRDGIWHGPSLYSRPNRTSPVR